MPNANITCPSCGFSREVPRDHIPAAGGQATCPRCKCRFLLAPISHDPVPGLAAPKKAPVEPPVALVDQTMGQGGQRTRLLLLCFVLMVLIFAGLRIWAEGEKRGLSYPNFIAASQTAVAVTWGDELMLFNRDGVQTGRQPLPRGAVPTQLSYVGDELWLADHTGNAIRRLRNGAWETVVDGGARFRAAFKFVVDTELGEIFVTDSANHAIHRFRTDGTYVGSFGREGKGAGELKFPNTVLLDGGNLVVANTNCFRIDLFGRDGQFLRTVATVAADGEYRYPTLLARCGDRLAFLLTADLRRARVMVYGADGTAVGRLPLPVPLDDAGDVAAFGSTVLVSDIGHRELHRFDAATLEYLGPFSTAIVERADATYRLEKRYAAMSRFALMALLLCCLPVFYLYYQTRQRQENRLGAVDAGAVLPVETLVGTGTDRGKLAVSAALFVLSVLVTLYVRTRHNHLEMLCGVLVDSLLGWAIIRLFVESGMTNPSRREQVSKLMRASAPALAHLLEAGESVTLCTALRRSSFRNQPTLLLLTDQRILLIDFAALRPTGFWQLGYGDISTVITEPARTGLAAFNRLLKLDLQRLTLLLKSDAGPEQLLLNGHGDSVIGQVAQAIR
jgi:hypothetical protein